MHTYSQSTGRWTHPAVGLMGVGYAGADPDPSTKGEAGEGKNRHDMQAVRSIGPLPVGRWTIASMSMPEDHAHGGDYLRLVPKSGTETFGRSGFLVHGDNVSRPGQASQGCIILPRLIRWAIWGSGDRDLEVVP